MFVVPVTGGQPRMLAPDFATDIEDAGWSKSGGSDLRYHRPAWFGGSPWQKDAPIENFWAHSPLSRIWKVKTPTLILMGEQDRRISVQQPIELYRALKDNGVPTRLYVAPREGHLWREPRHQLFKINMELEWFEKYAMGRTYVWEQPQTESTRRVGGTQQ